MSRTSRITCRCSAISKFSDRCKVCMKARTLEDNRCHNTCAINHFEVSQNLYSKYDTNDKRQDYEMIYQLKNVRPQIFILRQCLQSSRKYFNPVSFTHREDRAALCRPNLDPLVDGAIQKKIFLKTDCSTLLGLFSSPACTIRYHPTVFPIGGSRLQQKRLNSSLEQI